MQLLVEVAEEAEVDIEAVTEAVVEVFVEAVVVIIPITSSFSKKGVLGGEYCSTERILVGPLW